MKKLTILIAAIAFSSTAFTQKTEVKKDEILSQMWKHQLHKVNNHIEALQQLETIHSITDPEQRAELYKKVFGTCCDAPQTQIIS